MKDQNSIASYPKQRPRTNQNLQSPKNSPKLANKIDVIKLSIEIDTTSPMDAASGVAMLSGLTLYLFDRRITATSTKSERIIKVFVIKFIGICDKFKCFRVLFLDAFGFGFK